jgi:hypothetical protein
VVYWRPLESMNLLLIHVDISYSMPRMGSPDCGNSLVGDPLIEICCLEPDSCSTQSYEWNSTLLYKTTHESLRTSQTFSGSANVQ